MNMIINKKKKKHIQSIKKEDRILKRVEKDSIERQKRKEGTRVREREEDKSERDRGVFVSRGAKQPAKFRRAPCPPLSKYGYRGELTSEASPVVLYKEGASREREGGTSVNCGD